MKRILKRWLGVDSIEHRIETMEGLLLHKDSMYNGFAVLKKHLQPPENKATFNGKPLEQD